MSADYIIEAGVFLGPVILPRAGLVVTLSWHVSHLYHGAVSPWVGHSLCKSLQTAKALNPQQVIQQIPT